MSSSGMTGTAAGAAGNGGTGPTNNNNNNRRRWQGARNSNSTGHTPILNSIAGLEKAIFDSGPNAKPDQFQKSRVAIETYIQSTFKDPRDIIEAICTMSRPAAISLPPGAPAAKDLLHPEIYDREIIEYKLKFETYYQRSAQFTAD